MSCFRPERFPSSGGIEPLSSLVSKSIHFTLERFPSSGGIEPLSSLVSKSIPFTLERFASSGGIEPLSPFLLRSRRSAWWRFPSSGGIEPDRSWSVMRSRVRLVSSPSSGGIEPRSVPIPGPSPDNSSRVTRPPATVTPSHRDIGVPVSQLSASPAPTSVASDASRTSQSCTDPPLVTAEPPTAAEPAQRKVPGTAAASADHSPAPPAVVARTRTLYCTPSVSEPIVAVVPVPVCPASVQAVAVDSLYSRS